ncbi:MAG: hypothetical protein L3J69_13390 [Desulfobacula sp.]|nr:hypothetical protein [Desulfobacula sp.]
MSLILQHNLTVKDKKMGTAVKLTLTSQIEKERACYKTRFPKVDHKSVPAAPSQKAMWNLFVPF